MDGNKLENALSSASILKFPQNFPAGTGVLTAGARGEMTGVCTALLVTRLFLQGCSNKIDTVTI